MDKEPREKTIEVRIRLRCWNCGGLGYKPWHGTGWLARHTHGKCEACHGTGKNGEWIPMDRLADYLREP